MTLEVRPDPSIVFHSDARPDFAPFAERIANAKPDFINVFVPGGAPAVSFMKALAAQGQLVPMGAGVGEPALEVAHPALGERRARTVQAYLVSRGVPAGRLEIVSYGEERPKFDNSKEETRRLNRRAALTVKVQ